jgi:hypothetical protein
MTATVAAWPRRAVALIATALAAVLAGCSIPAGSGVAGSRAPSARITVRIDLAAATGS